MTQSDLPNSDSTSNSPWKKIHSELSDEMNSPLFDTDDESRGTREPENGSIELFPMPEASSQEFYEVSPEANHWEFEETSEPNKTEAQVAQTIAAMDSLNTPDIDQSSEDINALKDKNQVTAPPQNLNSAAESPIEEPLLEDNVSALNPEADSKSLAETDLAAITSPSDNEDSVNPALTSTPAKTTDKAKKSSPLGKLGRALTQNAFVKTILGFSGWPWILVLGASGATTITAFAWLASLPPVPDCKSPAGTWTQAGKLYCADQAARQKDPEALQSALALVGDWDESDPLFDQVQKLSNDWSRSILDVAQKELDQGQLNEAIKLAEQVPKTSSYYDEARQSIKDWQEDWKDGERILEKARDAIQVQDWAVAADQMRQLVQLGGEHWQRRADKVISEMTIEQDAFRRLNLANDRAAGGTVRDITSAIQMATKIDPKRLARKRLISYIDRWSTKLVDLADYYYEIGEYDIATEAAQAVPPGSKVGSKALAYIQASRAQQASQEDNTFGYIQAIAYASQVPKNSPLNSENRDNLKDWEQQVQSRAQLEFAKLFTRFDQKAGYQIAIDHASLIETDNPNRVAAQTLIAQWNKQQDSVTDRQAIARASKLAKRTDLSSVQAAIAEARRVKVDSPLRLRAQTLIAEWEGSIEKREDQPILDQAIALADNGELRAAIAKANEIDSDRALYDDAQDAAYEWTREIQIAEDDPILNEAYALAQRGELSAAIAKASEVGFGRALYYEAQDLIGQWIAERNAIEASRRRPEPAFQEEFNEPEDNFFEPQSNTVNQAPVPAQPYQEEYVDSATGAGLSGGPADL